MQQRSLPTVEITFLDGEKVCHSLAELSRRLIEARPDVVRVILFGSLARGDYGWSSDADLLIVLDRDKRRWMDRIPDFLYFFLEAPVPVDVFPYTTAEVNRMKHRRNTLIVQAFQEGIVLAERG